MRVPRQNGTGAAAHGIGIGAGFAAANRCSPTSPIRKQLADKIDRVAVPAFCPPRRACMPFVAAAARLSSSPR